MRSHFFAYIARMRFIQRWALMRNTAPENVQEHSHQVAVLAHALAVIRKLTEMLPPALQEDYRPILTIEDPEVAALVKAADKLSAYIKCLEELKAGNNEFREAAAQTRQALEGYGLPEVDYFLKTFLESFSLSLDELK